MLKLGILLFSFFFSVVYAQSDELKLRNEEKPYLGKILLIKEDVVRFKLDSTNFVFEFDKSNIDYIKSASGNITKFSDKEIEKLPEKPVEYDGILGAGYKSLGLYFSFQFTGEQNISVSGFTGKVDVKAAAAMGIEFDLINVMDYLRIGPGLMYYFPRTVRNTEASFNFVPIYGFIKYGSDRLNRVSFYFMGALGYNIFSGNSEYSGDFKMDGDIYYGFGAGLIFSDRLDVRGFYNRNQGNIELPEPFGSTKIIYSFYAIYLGYRI